MYGELIVTRSDGLLYLVWAGSLSLIITGVVFYALISGTIGTLWILMGMATALTAGGGLDMRAFRRLKRAGRDYAMPDVRKEFWRPRSLQQALSLTLPGTTPRGAAKVLLAPPALVILLGAAVKLWP